jgi:pimeloyl-ACP methyl ester carboxylesterase
MGATARNVTMVGIAPRGSVDSPMPVGQEHMVSTVASADDVDAVRRALALNTVSVLAWGSGATSAAVLKMLNPDVVTTMVLDSPSDPGVSQTTLAAKQIESSEVAVVEAMKWCASHISCPMNANVAKELNKFKTNLRVGRIDGGADYGTIARAGTAALAAGRPQDLFVAIAEATDGASQRLLGLGGALPTIASAYAPCADVSKKAAARIAEIYAANMNSQTRLIHIGAEAIVYGFCKDVPESTLTLGKIDAVKNAYKSDVLVLIARGDQVVPPYAARGMAKRMGWQYESVYANRHLVVGIDRAVTTRALQFLMKS